MKARIKQLVEICEGVAIFSLAIFVGVVIMIYMLGIVIMDLMFPKDTQ